MPVWFFIRFGRLGAGRTAFVTFHDVPPPGPSPDANAQGASMKRSNERPTPIANTFSKDDRQNTMIRSVSECATKTAHRHENL
jgi:hypothetical protein